MAFKLVLSRVLSVVMVDSEFCSKMCVAITSKLILSSESTEFVMSFMFAARLIPPKSSSMYKSSIDWICYERKEHFKIIRMRTQREKD